MQLRKEEEDLEEMRARNELRSLERSIRNEAKGFMCKEKDGPPALPVMRSPVKGKGREGGSSVGSGKESVGEEEENAPLSRPTVRRMSTAPSQKRQHRANSRITNPPSPPVPSSPILADPTNSTAQPLDLALKASTRLPPPDILVSDEANSTPRAQQPHQFGRSSLPTEAASEWSTYGMQQESKTREPIDEEGLDDDEGERSPVSPVGTYFVTYPPSSSSERSSVSGSFDSSVFAAPQAINSNLSLPISRTPPPPPSSSRIHNTTPPTVRISLLSPTDAPIAVSRPQYYDLSPRSSRRFSDQQQRSVDSTSSRTSPRNTTIFTPTDSPLDSSPTKSSGSPLQSVIDDYLHSSDDGEANEWDDSPQHDDDDEEEDEHEEETRQIKRRMEFLAVDMQHSQVARRKSSAAFAFDIDEARPVSLALPPPRALEDGRQAPSEYKSDNRTYSLDVDQDFRFGEGQTNAQEDQRRPPSMTFPRKMIRQPSLLILLPSINPDIQLSSQAGRTEPSPSRQSNEEKACLGSGGNWKGGSRSQSRSLRRSSRGGRSTCLEDSTDEGTSGEEAGGGEVGRVGRGDEKGEEEEEEGLDWSRRLAHLTGLFPFSMLGLLVVSANVFDSPLWLDRRRDGGGKDWWGGEEEDERRNETHASSSFGFGRFQRIGMNSLGSFEEMSVPALIWSQGIGCAFFGLILGKREELYFL